MRARSPHLRVCPPLQTPARPETPPNEAASVHRLPPTPSAQKPLSIEQLFSEHAGFVATLVLRVLGRDHEVDDLVQEVFLDAMTGLSSLQDPLAARGWLKTIAVRKACRHLRKRRLRCLLGMDANCCYEHLADADIGPEQRALLSRVYQQLDALSVADRVAWTLRYVDGQPLEQVASLCGCSLATAKRRILAAQTELKRRLGHG